VWQLIQLETFDMNSLITAYSSELTNLCQHYHVRRLELFGSAVQDKIESEIGDIDFLVEFGDLGQSSHADAYFGLLESMQKLFGKPIDLVMLSAVKNPYLLQSIASNRTTLYAA
jgi:predicted nucleotidyltransferase